MELLQRAIFFKQQSKRKGKNEQPFNVTGQN